MFGIFSQNQLFNFHFMSLLIHSFYCDSSSYIQTYSQIYSLFMLDAGPTPLDDTFHFMLLPWGAEHVGQQPSLDCYCSLSVGTEEMLKGDFLVSNSSLLLNTLMQWRKQFVPSVKLKWISFLLYFKFQGTDKVSEFQVSGLALLTGCGLLICKYGESCK